MYKLRPIRTEQDYEEALTHINKLWDAKHNTSKGDLLDILVTLVEKYESECFQIAAPDPVEAIKFAMEQFPVKRSQLDKVLGGRNRTSEILNKKRKLSLNMIRKLHNDLNIGYDVLMTDYRLEK